MGVCAKYDSWEKACNLTSCQVCNRCNSCNNKPADPGPCNTKQNLCSIDSQLAKDYAPFGESGAPNASRDQIIIKVFPRSLMNILITWIKNKAKLGKEGMSPQPNISAEGRDFVYHDKINQIIEGMNTIDYTNNTAHFQRDQIITSATFNRIMNKIKNMKINNAMACDECVTNCNANCQSCNNCVSCQGCNTCITQWQVYCC